MKLSELQETLNELHKWAQNGCGDGNCVIKKPKGMHTNGGCRCIPKRFSEILHDLSIKLTSPSRHGSFEKEEQ